MGGPYDSLDEAPRDRSKHAAAWCAGRMWVFGGQAGQATNDTWAFDPETNSWAGSDG